MFRTQLSDTQKGCFFSISCVRQFINWFPKVVVVATQLNILWGSLLCCQHKLSSCICRTGNRIAAEEQLQFQFLVGIAADEIVYVCNQCNYASSQAGIFRTHLKMHSEETSKKCNQCHFKCSFSSYLRRHMGGTENIKIGLLVPFPVIVCPNLLESRHSSAQ